MQKREQSEYTYSSPPMAGIVFLLSVCGLSRNASVLTSASKLKAAATRAIFCLRWLCDFFQKLSRHRRAVVAILDDKVRDFVARNSTH